MTHQSANLTSVI